MVGAVTLAAVASRVRGLLDAMYVEGLKLRRSRLPVISLSAFTIAAAIAGLFTFIAQDSARARSLGLLGAKAQLSTVPATWPGHLAFLAQITAIGGFLVFGVTFVWVFGREFADHTAKDLLALPTARTTIVTAKLAVAAAWCLALSVGLFALGVLVATPLQLPEWSIGGLVHALLRLLVTALMTILLAGPLALAASAGRGYLAGLWTLFALLFSAQVLAALGYGGYFPWSVPALYSGLAGPGTPAPGPVGYILVALVGTLSYAGSLLWWQRADHAS
jgi:ABC-2 type transport system permease protein